MITFLKGLMWTIVSIGVGVGFFAFLYSIYALTAYMGVEWNAEIWVEIFLVLIVGFLCWMFGNIILMIIGVRPYG